MTNIDSVLKSRDITLLTNVCRVKATVFPVATYSCKSQRVKKRSAEELMPSNWCWRRVLRIPCYPETARRSNPSILREINSEYSLEGLMLERNSSIRVIWCKQLTHWKSPWCWESLRAEGEEGVRGWRGGWHHQCNGLGQTLGDGEGHRELAYCSPWGLKESDTTEATYRACTQARCTPLEQGKPHTTHTQPKVDIHKHI